jgi:O-antigen ligase
MTLIAIIFGLSIGIPLTSDARITAFDFLSLAFIGRYLGVFIRDAHIRRMFILLAVYVAAVSISTVYNAMPIQNLARRVGSALMLAMDVSGPYLFFLHSGRRNLAIMLASMMLGVLLYLIYPIDTRVSEEPIKLLAGTPISVLLGIFCLSLKRSQFFQKFVASVASLLLAVIFFSLGSRNAGGVLFVFAILLWVSVSERRIEKIIRHRSLLLKYFAVMVLAGYGLVELYTYVAISGYFGDRAADIATFQKGIFGSMLLGGRPEIYINLVALSESPFVGWGPFAEDRPHQLQLLETGVYGEDWYVNDGNLYHSMIFGAGHEAGIFAMLLWLAFLYWCLKACIISLAPEGKERYFLPLLITSIWSLLFSPLISLGRPQLGATVAFSFWVIACANFRKYRKAVTAVRPVLVAPGTGQK